MPEWQPIETAPKDGSRILLFCARVLNPIHTGHWFFHEKNVGGQRAFRYDGWWLDGFEHPFNYEPFIPTHWQPLPEPPEVNS